MKIDYTRDGLLTEHALEMLADRYMVDGENTPQDALARAAKAFADDDDHAQRIYDYASKQWFMFATPILSNGGLERGLPISCFLNYVDDSLDDIGEHWKETAFLSASGGGVGGYWGALRSSGEDTSRGSSSGGPLKFLKVVDSEILAVSQGKTRRGSYAAYMDVSHPEIEKFLNVRKPTGGDENYKCLNLHHGVNIPDAFMELVEKRMSDPEFDDSWDLVDPHSGKVTKTVSASQLWIKILELRLQTGEPYMHFIDASNRALPQPLKDRGLKISQSNLCSEITLPTAPDRTAVCCLSSVNADLYDEWKDDPIFIEDLMRMLDNVLTSFIEKVRTNPKFKGLWRAAKSAEQERSVGLGLMGFHSYLQRHGIPFETPMALSINRNMFTKLNEDSSAASLKLGAERGEAPDMAGTGHRFAHRLAVAPNASSSIICGGVSPSVELMRANAYVEKTLSGSHLKKNPHLETLLRQRADEFFPVEDDSPIRDSTAIEAEEDWWSEILQNKGSVQSLGCLSEWEKDVFKTAMEVDQTWVVEHAVVRTPLICQSQSINLFLPSKPTAAELHLPHFLMWKKGGKTLYYCRSESSARPENVAAKIAENTARQLAASQGEEDVCLACEG